MDGRRMAFDVRPGADGRYFGYISGYPEANRTALALYSVDKFGHVEILIDEDRDEEYYYSEQVDSAINCQVHNNGYDMEDCLVRGPAGDDFEAEWLNWDFLDDEKNRHLLHEPLGQVPAQAPAEWTPATLAHGFYAGTSGEALRQFNSGVRPEASGLDNPPPQQRASTTSGNANAGASGGACWERVQSEVAAEMQSRISNATGICPAAKLSVELYSSLRRRAVNDCQMSGSIVRELDSLIAQSQATVENSCLR